MLKVMIMSIYHNANKIMSIKMCFLFLELFIFFKEFLEKSIGNFFSHI